MRPEERIPGGERFEEVVEADDHRDIIGYFVEDSLFGRTDRKQRGLRNGGLKGRGTLKETHAK